MGIHRRIKGIPRIFDPRGRQRTCEYPIQRQIDFVPHLPRSVEVPEIVKRRICLRIDGNVDGRPQCGVVDGWSLHRKYGANSISAGVVRFT